MTDQLFDQQSTPSDDRISDLIDADDLINEMIADPGQLIMKSSLMDDDDNPTQMHLQSSQFGLIDNSFYRANKSMRDYDDDHDHYIDKQFTLTKNSTDADQQIVDKPYHLIK